MLLLQELEQFRSRFVSNRGVKLAHNVVQGRGRSGAVTDTASKCFDCMMTHRTSATVSSFYEDKTDTSSAHSRDGYALQVWVVFHAPAQQNVKQHAHGKFVSGQTGRQAVLARTKAKQILRTHVK